jgi:hypothetical protein
MKGGGKAQSSPGRRRSRRAVLLQAVGRIDTGANEIFFERMDGAYLGSGEIARHVWTRR